MDINYSSKQSSVNKDQTQKNPPCFLKMHFKIILLFTARFPVLRFFYICGTKWYVFCEDRV